jgi:ergothioneine biosynthesis protein EgtB
MTTSAHRDRCLRELATARAASDAVFARLAPEAIWTRPIAERHRLVFYLGHLEAFDANLFRHAVDVPADTPAWDRLFARGIDPIDGDVPTDTPADWPRLEEIAAYGRRIRGAIDGALAGDGAWRHDYLADGRLADAAIEHRLMHVETLAYLLHQLPLGQVAPAADAAPPAATAPPTAAHRVAIPAGRVTLGLAGGFGWDNELGEHPVDVAGFAIDPYPVTNADFAAFVDAGGYDDRALWTDADWAWRTADGTGAPRFWRRKGGAWWLRRLADEVPLPPDAPVYVAHAEAAAYARWRGGRLPTEAEWHRAAYGAPDGTERAYPWGDAPPDPSRGNFDLARDDVTAVTAHPAGASAWGVHDLVGNGWEWTSTPFAPLPGFAAAPYYPGYSADFFDGRHFVMKGGSPRTAARFLRRSFRNWFQPHYPFVYATFRLVED